MSTKLPQVATIATDFGVVMLSQRASELVSPLHDQLWAAESRRFSLLLGKLQGWLQPIYEQGRDVEHIVIRASQIRKWISA